MTNPNFAQDPQPTESLYIYDAGPEGTPHIDEVYNNPGDVVEVARLAAERTSNPMAQDLGPITIATRAETPGPDGHHEIRLYALTSKYALNPRKQEAVGIDPYDASQVQAVTIGARWQTPFGGGKPTKDPVWFVARPRTTAFTQEQMDTATRKPGVQSPTAVCQRLIEDTFGKDVDFG